MFFGCGDKHKQATGQDQWEIRWCGVFFLLYKDQNSPIRTLFCFKLPWIIPGFYLLNSLSISVLDCKASSLSSCNKHIIIIILLVYTNLWENQSVLPKERPGDPRAATTLGLRSSTVQQAEVGEVIEVILKAVFFKEQKQAENEQGRLGKDLCEEK